MSKNKKKKNISFVDAKLVTIILCLISFGLIMLYSTSYYSAKLKFGDDMFFFNRQALYSLVSIIVMFIVARISIKFFEKLSFLFWLISLGLMLLVQTPLGVESYGAKRWIGLPLGITIQPSEIAKIAVILFVAAVIKKLGDRINQKASVLEILFIAFVTCIIVYLFNDHLSSAIIIFIVTVGMIFIVHKKTSVFVISGGVIITGMFALAVLIGEVMEKSRSFRLARILVWLHPENHSEAGGYQIMQGLYAIGSGGFLGKGLGNSAQKLGVIPEVQNDMILAIICEELGVIGVIILLFMFGYLLYRLVCIARETTDIYSSLVVTGIFIHIALQVILNMCVVLNVIPATGITLPFISYGGSSILFLMIEMGIALGVSNRTRKNNYKQLMLENVEG